MPNKTVIIMRGWPGSGKSTKATSILGQRLKSGGTLADIVSADFYFTDPITGQYEYDPRDVEHAHSYCKMCFREAVKLGSDLIIVDNTNIKRQHYEYYVDYAKRAGYEVYQAVPETPWKDDVEACQAKTKDSGHNVPLDIVRKMKREFEQDTGLGFFECPGDTSKPTEDNQEGK